MSYFKFRQNNSFGHFVGTPLVFVQADNAADANSIAQDQPSSYGYGGGVTVYSDGDKYIDYCGDTHAVKVIQQNH